MDHLILFELVILDIIKSLWAYPNLVMEDKISCTLYTNIYNNEANIDSYDLSNVSLKVCDTLDSDNRYYLFYTCITLTSLLFLLTLVKIY
jgi:hypothetical protein